MNLAAILLAQLGLQRLCAGAGGEDERRRHALLRGARLPLMVGAEGLAQRLTGRLGRLPDAPHAAPQPQVRIPAVPLVQLAL
eukprot:1176382-Prorocentrum_minimum.AAC.6